MKVDLIRCGVCGKQRPLLSMSTTEEGICKACSTKLLRQARIDDETWVEQNRRAGIDLWDYQPQEPASAFTAWQIVRNNYPKRLRNCEIAEIMDVSESAVGHWAARWKWDMRWNAWVLEQDRLKLEQEAKDRREMNDRQIKVARSLHDKSMARLESIDPDEMSPNEVKSWLELANKIEREARASNEELNRLEVSTSAVKTAEENKSTTDKDTTKEILEILISAGALGHGSVSIKTSTETVVDIKKPEDEKAERIDVTPDNIVEVDFNSEPPYED